MRTNRWHFATAVLLVGLLGTAPSQAGQRRALLVVSGGSPGSNHRGFYEELKETYRQLRKAGYAREHIRVAYAGGPDSPGPEAHWHLIDDETGVPYRSAERLAAMKQLFHQWVADGCRPEGIVLKPELHDLVFQNYSPTRAQLVRLARDLDGDGSGDVNTGTRLADIKAELQRLNGMGLGEGDRVFIHLSSHGVEHGRLTLWGIGDWTQVGNGLLSERWLRKYLKPLAARGVKVNVNVRACYSGGFLRLSEIPNVVVTTDNVDWLVSLGSLGPTQTYEVIFPSQLAAAGSQLEAWRRAHRADPLNDARTTLDWLVARYIKAVDPSPPATQTAPATQTQPSADPLAELQQRLDGIGEDDLEGDPDVVALRLKLLGEIREQVRRSRAAAVKPRDWDRFVCAYSRAAVHSAIGMVPEPERRLTNPSYRDAATNRLMQAFRQDRQHPWRQSVQTFAYAAINYNKSRAILRARRTEAERLADHARFALKAWPRWLRHYEAKLQQLKAPIFAPATQPVASRPF